GALTIRILALRLPWTDVSGRGSLPENGSARAVRQHLRVLYCAESHGTSTQYFLSLGDHPAGVGDFSLHPPPPGYLLALDHSLRRWARRGGLHRRRSAARHGSAPAIFQSLSPPPPYKRARGRYPG